MKVLIAVMLGLGLIFVGSGSAQACSWNDCNFGVITDPKANRSVDYDFPKRQSHTTGWHNSKVCGLELCSGKTASESTTFNGMTQSGMKYIITNQGFDGKYFIKGTLP